MAQYRYTQLCLVTLPFILGQLAVSSAVPVVINAPLPLHEQDGGTRNQLEEYAIQTTNEYIKRYVADVDPEQKKEVATKGIELAIEYMNKAKAVLEDESVFWLVNMPMPPDELIGSPELQEFALEKANGYVKLVMTEPFAKRKALYIQTATTVLAYLQALSNVLNTEESFTGFAA